MSLNSKVGKIIIENILIYRSDVFSNMNNFRLEGKYVDVIIQCEDTSFQCHRIILASATNFFDSRFSGNIRGSMERNIVTLPKTSAKIFEYVLQFIYTGDVAVTSANALDILEASDFFGLPGMEQLVMLFVEKTRMNIKNTLDLFQFVCKKKKQGLFRRLRDDIVLNLAIASRSKVFFEISYEDFSDIVNRYKYMNFRPAYDDVLLGAITRWIIHNQEKRGRYFEQLSPLITDFNPQWMRCMTNFLISGSESSLLSCLTDERPSDFYDTSDEKLRMEENFYEKSMYIYVRYAEENLMRVFSMKSKAKFSFSCEVPLFQPNHWMKCIDSEGYLYSLHYIRRDSDYSDPSARSQSFRVSNSVNMGSTLYLKAPPVIFGDVSLCALQNQIYVYNQTTFQCPRTPNIANSRIFSDEEIGRGIYVYNCELDLWFPVPAMKRKLQNACMTSTNNELYLIGGESVDNTNCTCYAQTYDHRSGVWNILPRTTNNYVRADCCLSPYFKVYVCGGVIPAFEEYDIVAGKWAVLTPPPIQKQYYKFTCSKSKHRIFYAMSGETGDLSIQIFNESAKGRWINSSKLAEEAKEITGDITTATILDSVTF